MFEAYIGRNRKLCLRPIDPEGEEELRELVKLLKQNGLDALDIETQMPEDQYNQYKRQKQHGSEYTGSRKFGFNPRQSPSMESGFGITSHLPWPYLLPFILESGYPVPLYERGVNQERNERGRDERGERNYQGDDGRDEPGRGGFPR
jgi:hypothetical protein